MPMTEEQALAGEGQSAFTPTPSPTGGLMTPSTYLQELVDPGSTAPPPPVDTSMYAAPVEAQYQPGGSGYVAPYDPGAQYGMGSSGGDPAVMWAQSQPTDPYNTAPAGSYPSSSSTYTPAPPYTTSYTGGGASTYYGGATSARQQGQAVPNATEIQTLYPASGQSPHLRTTPPAASTASMALAQTMSQPWARGTSNPYANVRTREYPGVAQLNPSLMRPSANTTAYDESWNEYWRAQNQARLAQKATPPSLAGAGSGSLIPFQPPPPPIMDPMRSTEGDSVSDIAPTISPSDIPAPGGDPFAGWGTNAKVHINRLQQWGRDNLADPAPAQDSRDERGSPIAPIRDTPFSPAMDRAASTSYIPGATLLPSELLQPPRNASNAAPVTDPYGAWKSAFGEGNPYLVRRAGEVRGLGVGLTGSLRNPRAETPLATTTTTPTPATVPAQIPDQKRATTQIVTIDESGRPAVTGFAASGRQPQGAVHVTEEMIDALIAGGVKINRDTAMQTLLGQRAVLPAAWMELIGAIPAETTETATPATENPYTASSSTSSGGGGGSTWVDYGSSGRGSGSGGRGYSYGYDSADGAYAPEAFGAENASEGNEDADMWDNPIFARYLAILEGRYGREGAMRRMRGMSRRFRFGSRLSRSTRPSSRSKTRSRAVTDGDASSGVPTNAGIRKDVTKRVKKATK